MTAKVHPLGDVILLLIANATPGKRVVTGKSFLTLVCFQLKLAFIGVTPLKVPGQRATVQTK
jgi:hypothetical protein